MRSGRGLGRRGRGGIRSGRWRRSVRRRSSGRRRWAGVCSGEEEPSLALPPPSRESQRRNPFPTCRLVERSPGDGSGIDAETPARVHPNGHVGLPGAVRPREWKAGENARNPPGKAATKQALGRILKGVGEEQQCVAGASAVFFFFFCQRVGFAMTGSTVMAPRAMEGEYALTFPCLFYIYPSRPIVSPTW
jgi:hypothetical protein